MNPSETSKSFDTATIYAFGIAVFGEERRFTDWISQPLPALGGLTPISLLDSEAGRQDVYNLIGRISYGVYF